MGAMPEIPTSSRCTVIANALVNGAFASPKSPLSTYITANAAIADNASMGISTAMPRLRWGRTVRMNNMPVSAIDASGTVPVMIMLADVAIHIRMAFLVVCRRNQ